jgi:hypothetical protein
MKPKKLPLLSNPDDVDGLLQALQAYGMYAERDSKVSEALRAGGKESADFMTRFYQSPYYKNIVGGREMMYSDQGFEDSAEGERIRNIRFTSNPYQGSRGRYMGPGTDVAKEANLGTLADLRNPAGLIEINTNENTFAGRGAMYDPYLYTHEMSHATGEPAQDAFIADGELYPSSQSFDRHMLEGNPSRPYMSKYGFFTTRDPVHIKPGESVDEALAREQRKTVSDYEQYGGKYREPFAAPGVPIKRESDALSFLNLDYLASRKNENLKPPHIREHLDYLQNPTEIAARMRAVTHRLQDEGLMDQDDFDLTYDKLYRAYQNGDPQAMQILQAMGVVSMLSEGGKYEDFSSEPLHNYSANWSGKRETIADRAKEKYNKYIRGKV